jgi:hypothetical protein
MHLENKVIYFTRAKYTREAERKESRFVERE